MTLFYIISLIVIVTVLLITLREEFSICNKVFIFVKRETHLFYKYDLTIRFFRWSILIMWLPTHNNTRIIEHFLSFSLYSEKIFNTLLKFHLINIPNPKYI